MYLSDSSDKCICIPLSDTVALVCEGGPRCFVNFRRCQFCIQHKVELCTGHDGEGWNLKNIDCIWHWYVSTGIELYM